MRLSTWDPFSEMEAVLNRYRPQISKAANETISQADWYPNVDVSESDDGFHLHVELAGVKKEDIQINVHENVLTLSGHRTNHHEQSKQKVHRIERSYGAFVRNFTLPDNAAVDQVNARVEDGILNIDIPKSKEEKPKRIEISIN